MYEDLTIEERKELSAQLEVIREYLRPIENDTVEHINDCDKIDAELRDN